MPKLDPKGEVPNPIKAKLAQEIATPPIRQSSAESSKKPLGKISDLLSPRKKVTAKLTRVKKVLINKEEQRENDAVVMMLSNIIGTDSISWSHVDRALWSLLRHAQDQIEAHAKDAPQLVRPSNNNSIEVAYFEDQLAAFLLTLFKDIPRSSL